MNIVDIVNIYCLLPIVMWCAVDSGRRSTPRGRCLSKSAFFLYASVCNPAPSQRLPEANCKGSWVENKKPDVHRLSKLLHVCISTHVHDTYTTHTTCTWHTHNTHTQHKLTFTTQTQKHTAYITHMYTHCNIPFWWYMRMFDHLANI